MPDKQQLNRRTVLGATGAIGLAALLPGIAASDHHAPSDVESVSLERIGRYSTGEFDGGAEIVAFDSENTQLFVVNSTAGQIEVLDFSNPSELTQIAVLDAAEDVENGGGANSIDVVNGLAAVAVERDPAQEPGAIALYDADSLELRNTVEVGALPDKVTIAPDGNAIVSANEGEPNFDEPAGERTDPMGSISVIDIADGVNEASVETLTFEPFDDEVEALREETVRIVGASEEDDDATPSTDFEPEYVSIGSDSETAFVSLQENNAIATVDIHEAEITAITGLGAKDFSLIGNELDTSDADAGDSDVISLQSWPIKGLYQPDGITTTVVDGTTYLFTANEGDSRDFEVSTVGELALDDDAFEPLLSENPFADSVSALQAPENLGNLEVTNQLGDTDDDGEFEELYTFGARSFSVWEQTDDGFSLVFDSGNDLERIYAEQFPDGLQGSTRSGPEPEGVELGHVGDRTFAFVGTERGSVIFVYDVTAPTSPEYVQAVVNRDYSVTFEDLAADAEADPDSDEPERAGDWGPEGIEFIPESESPTDGPLLAVGYEVSGTVAVFEVASLPDKS